ncbi:MAG: hypothetical protein A2Y57_02070 [Candidatus Woykebacteria bacterium RBG_13_40_7b]|uniref:Uncharacterized protein n=1 Tax=Candidatus Woykebacteria bacterium RBG_13_40_7b TaxID=1802594 RepID=A0A1G1W9Y4_9BACT|nr:MAG: hypothetical protein A2Y57_02070 [Candidatus Woykebacteria bacterium RBG_13_40_7b]
MVRVDAGNCINKMRIKPAEDTAFFCNKILSVLLAAVLGIEEVCTINSIVIIRQEKIKRPGSTC